MPPHISQASSPKAGSPLVTNLGLARPLLASRKLLQLSKKNITWKDSSFHFLSNNYLLLFSIRKGFGTSYCFNQL